MFSLTEGTSLLYDRQRGLLKIPQLLMNVDKQLRQIIDYTSQIWHGSGVLFARFANLSIIKLNERHCELRIGM